MSGDGLRHFLDLTDIAPEDLRAMIETSRALKAQRRERAGDKSKQAATQ